MGVTLRKPDERACELCGRTETWDEEAATWLVDGDQGSVYCIHEWDINGAFSTVRE